MKRFSIGVAVLIALVGCKFDKRETKIQYMPDMVDAPSIKSQQDYLDPPEGSVAWNAEIYPRSVEEAELILRNPNEQLQDQTKVLARGKKLFGTYCTPCHGTNAEGDGTVVPKVPMPPNLLADFYRQKGDGFYFYKITFGSAIMPSYGHATWPAERWDIVSYVRDLQGRGR
ncbi:MAG: cytochrome c [Oligoflexales bacterium]